MRHHPACTATREAWSVRLISLRTTELCLQGFDELDTVFTNKKKRSRGGAKTKASASSSRGINQANRKLKER